MKSNNKQSDNKLTMAMIGNRTKLIIWWLVTGFFAAFAAGGISVMFDKDKDINPVVGTVMTLFCLAAAAGGFLNLRKCFLQKAALAKYREYIPRLSDDPEKSTGKLAASMGVPVEKVEKHLEQLIKLGLIRNAYVDKAAHKLVLPDLGLYEKAPKTVMVPVRCSCCCGTTSVPENTVGVCQYCGSPVSAK